MTEIAFDVQVQIQNKSRYGDTIPGYVRTETPSEQKETTERFLKNLFGEARVEFLSRNEVPSLGPHGRMFDRPSSILFQAVHACFSGHYALALSPEILWHQVMSEIATCVKQNPDDYRHLFTKAAEGQMLIEVRANHLIRGHEGNNWNHVLNVFERNLSELVPGNLLGTMLPKFSTETLETRSASLVTFMAAASKFYDYRVRTMCGIPRIRLLGTLEDYQRMVSSAEALAPLFTKHLGLYFENLIPVLRKLVSEIAGPKNGPDTQFWTSIYKYESSSGSSTCNGWITAFVNYIQEPNMNPAPDANFRFQANGGSLVQKSPESFNWNVRTNWHMPGIATGSVPTQIATAPFTWLYYDEVFPMTFFSGPLGVDIEDGFVTPKLGFGILG